MNIVRIPWLHIYISAWGSALLVQTTVGNAKASKRGTGNDTGSRAFFIWPYEQTRINRIRFVGELQDIYIFCYNEKTKVLEILISVINGIVVIYKFYV